MSHDRANLNRLFIVLHTAPTVTNLRSNNKQTDGVQSDNHMNQIKYTYTHLLQLLIVFSPN